MYCENYVIIYNGIWLFGIFRFVVQYDFICNNCLEEGLVGFVEGQIGVDCLFSISKLENYCFSGEFNFLLYVLFEQVLMVGVEWNKEIFNDLFLFKQGFVGSDSLLGIFVVGL